MISLYPARMEEKSHTSMSGSRLLLLSLWQSWSTVLRFSAKLCTSSENDFASSRRFSTFVLSEISHIVRRIHSNPFSSRAWGTHDATAFVIESWAERKIRRDVETKKKYLQVVQK